MLPFERQMFHRAKKKNAVYCQNKGEHINTMGGQNAELLVLNLAVHAHPLGCKGLPNVQQTVTVMYDIKLQDTV